MRGTTSRVAMAGALLSLMAFSVQEADAQRRGGGAARGGGATSVSRGGGGGGGSFSRGGNYSRPAGAGGQRSGSRGRAGQRPGAGASQLPAQGGGASQLPARGGGASQLPARGGGASQLPSGGGNRGGINTGDINIGTGGGNWGGCTGSGCDINVKVKHEYKYSGWGGYYDYPRGAYAAGVVAGAAITAAVIGSRYYTLPPGCAPYPYRGYTYYTCGGAWYYPQYQGDTVVYVVVARPY